MDLLDIHLDLLDTDLPSKYFVFLQDILMMSSRQVFKTSSTHVSKVSWRHLQHNNFSSSKTSSGNLERRRCWRRLQDMSWRRIRDVLKTNKYLQWLRSSIFDCFYFFFSCNSKSFMSDCLINCNLEKKNHFFIFLFCLIFFPFYLLLLMLLLLLLLLFLWLQYYTSVPSRY